jgi:uncharacterized protein (TIGR03000 family)
MNRWTTAFAALLAIVLLASTALAQGTITVPANKALLIIRVPSPSATVRIGDYSANQQGTERFFMTPVLGAGRYSYEVEARWKDGAQEKKVTRTASFEAGDVVTVDFRAGAPENVGLPKATPSKERHFLFTYGGKIKNLPPGKEANVWLPLADSGPEQQVSISNLNLPPGSKTESTTEKLYGNSMIFFVAKADAKGEIPFEIVYDVRRKEVKSDVAANLTLQPAKGENLKRFLEADAKVPISGKPLDLLKDKTVPVDQFAAAKVMYDVVNTHMKYSKEGKGWGQGDSVWACDSKFGNCSDFHSLFISMARGNKIPSKFEMGFPIPVKHGEGVVGGYHCWAWFMPNGKGWVPVDISEANRNPELKEYYFGNLTEDRVRFTTGRDIDLEPRQKGPALNFFIYPYAEVDGQVHLQENIERRFAYQDVK